ncbi:MAG: hypothetical protein RLZZ447_560 [Verrucomicrobiota bacterium]
MSGSLPAGHAHGRRWWLAGAVACASRWIAGPLHAAGPAGVVTLRFTVFSPRPPGDVAYVAAVGQPPTRLRFFPLARSPRYEYRGPATLRFIAPQDRTLLAEVEIPAGMTHALIVLLPEEKAPGRWRAIVLDDGDSRFRAGHLMMVDLSGLELEGTLNARPLKLGPGPNPAQPAPRTSQLVLRARSRGASYQALATDWSLADGERALLLLLPPLRAGTFTVQHRLLIDRPAARVSR